MLKILNTGMPMYNGGKKKSDTILFCGVCVCVCVIFAICKGVQIISLHFTSIFVTKFDKTRLPYASSFTSLMVHS